MRPLLAIAVITGFCYMLLLVLLTFLEDLRGGIMLPPPMNHPYEDDLEYSSEGLELPADAESMLRH